MKLVTQKKTSFSKNNQYCIAFAQKHNVASAPKHILRKGTKNVDSAQKLTLNKTVFEPNVDSAQKLTLNKTVFRYWYSIDVIYSLPKSAENSCTEKTHF
jgi:hypothetical protein